MTEVNGFYPKKYPADIFNKIDDYATILPLIEIVHFHPILFRY